MITWIIDDLFKYGSVQFMRTIDGVGFVLYTVASNNTDVIVRTVIDLNNNHYQSRIFNLDTNGDELRRVLKLDKDWATDITHGATP